jgi:hypothetical protein
MKLLILILLLCPSFSHADQWFCTDEASQRTGDTIKVCGIGESKEEGPARIKALQNSQQEFYELCRMSSDCIDHYVVSAPLRTECTKEDGIYKCYRMVQYTIQELKKN